MISPARKWVLAAAGLLFAVWAARNASRVFHDDQLVAFCLGTLFAVLILMRRKPREAPLRDPWGGWAPTAAVGALAAVGGIVLRVHQLEWLGVIVMLFACLRWALPQRYARDVLLAFLLLYWANPLPGQFVARLQLWMQLWSILGAEALLQWFNHRVWADGLVLWSGFRSFGVPEACSGFRTATTVAVSAMGTAVLLRFRWHQGLALLALGTVQVLLLNVVRIAFMAAWAPRMPREWAERFLHDTLGIFLLLTIVLLQVEALAWRGFAARRREVRDGRARGEVEVPEKASILPRLWTLLLRWTPAVAAVVALALGVAFVAVRNRPYHRASMISGVVDGLMETQPEAAERAVAAALALTPGDTELLSKKARVLSGRGKHGEALAALDALRSRGAESPPDTVLRSWLLMVTGELEQAIALVDSLPPELQQRPAVAMVRAEYALRRGHPDEVAEHLRRVGRSPRYIQRIRAMFPYLEQHEQWDVVRAVDTSHPYDNVNQGLIALRAFLRVNDLAGSGDVLRRCLKQWPDDARHLGPLFAMATAQPGGEWGEHAGAVLRRHLRSLSVGELALFMGYALRMGRPDLGWVIFNRLVAVAPDDPSRHLALAQHTLVWFRLRKHELGMEDEDPAAVVNAKPLYVWTRATRQFGPLWRTMPVMEELATVSPDAVRAKYLQLCLAALARREAAGELEQRLEMDYPMALTLARRYDEAHARWNRVEARFPERKSYVALQRARLYDLQTRWEECYEELRNYEAAGESPNLTATLLRIGALLHLGLGEQALEALDAGRRLFPVAQQLDLALSAVWDVFGFKEDALFELTRTNLDPGSQAAVQLLYDTGRFVEVERRSAALGVEVEKRPGSGREYLVPTPAERAVTRAWPPPLTDKEMAEEAKRFRDLVVRDKGPLMRALHELHARWFESRGAAAASDPDRWEAAGRDPAEKMSALKQLTMLLARQQRYPEAAAAMERALAHAPHNRALWRVRIALSEGDAAVVGRAYAAVPNDGYVWLAHLVARAGTETNMVWAEAEAQRAVTSQAFSPGIVARAGDFLLRRNAPRAAAILARDAMARSLGLPQTYALGARCALALRNMRWALECALKGVESARDPGPFYRVVVAVKSAGSKPDRYLIEALEYLRTHYDGESEWGERLGRVYFEGGDPKRALALFAAVIAEDIRSVRIQSLLMAAEAARLLGDTERAIGVLEAAYAMYPRKVSLLNNLVYSLAQNPATVGRARDLLPQLLERGGDSFAVLDTAALVCLRAGDLDAAELYISQALERIDEEDYGALETRLNAAEIEFRRGNVPAAEQQLKRIRSYSEIPQMVEAAARALQDRIREGGQP